VLRGVLLGLPGVAVLPFAIAPPPGIPAAALAVNPAVLLLVASLAGAWAAPRIGARSAVILGSPFRVRPIAVAAAQGLVLGVAVALVDGWTALLWRGLASSPPAVVEGGSPGQTLFGVLYGGFTEEILMRWGVLSLAALGLLRVLPRRGALLGATVLAALLFAAGHLPGLVALGADLTPALITRTMAFNLLLGLAFGWTFLRRGLEAAIGMHAGFHLGVAALVVALEVAYG
jgi:hypothetical protein